MFNFFKKMLGLPTAEEKAEASAKPREVVEGIPAPIFVEGAGVVNTTWPFPTEDKPAQGDAQGEKKAKVKKARAPKDASAPKKPRAKKAKQ